MEELIKNTIEKALQELNLEINFNIEISIPKENVNGDFSSNIALKLAKSLEKSPLEIAELLKLKIIEQSEFKEVKVAMPGFLNFYVNKNFYTDYLKSNFLNPSYKNISIYSDQKWLIEHTSPNPNKAMHLGHLRNNLTGMAVSNLAKAIGVNVVMDCVDNNRGIAIAKLMWGYLVYGNKDVNKRVDDLNYWFNNQSEWLNISDLVIPADKFMDKMYVLGVQEFKDEKVELKIRNLVVEWENENKVVWALWEKVLSFVYAGQSKTLQRIGSHWDFIWHEHEHYKEGKDLVKTGLNLGIFKKTDDGAVVTDLKDFKIPNTILIKRDGTSLYITQDLALTKKKVEKFNPTKLFWIIGPEQTLAMQQVFAVCSQLKLGDLNKFVHLPYGFISIKGQGKMSSRAGNTIYIDDLIDESKQKVLQKLDKSKFSTEEQNIIAEKIGLASIKYSILKVGRLTDTAFDFDTSLSFEGDSAPYLLYTYARIASIKKQYAKEIDIPNNLENILTSIEEVDLLKHIYKFKGVIIDAAISYSPNLICEYLFAIAQLFNKFYGKHSVLKAEDLQLVNARLILISVVADILNYGLSLLGIETLESM